MKVIIPRDALMTQLLQRSFSFGRIEFTDLLQRWWRLRRRSSGHDRYNAEASDHKKRPPGSGGRCKSCRHANQDFGVESVAGLAGALFVPTGAVAGALAGAAIVGKASPAGVTCVR